jgi:hypothetical protein
VAVIPLIFFNSLLCNTFNETVALLKPRFIVESAKISLARIFSSSGAHPRVDVNKTKKKEEEQDQEEEKEEEEEEEEEERPSNFH